MLAAELRQPLCTYCGSSAMELICEKDRWPGLESVEKFYKCESCELYSVGKNIDVENYFRSAYDSSNIRTMLPDFQKSLKNLKNTSNLKKLIKAWIFRLGLRLPIYPPRFKPSELARFLNDLRPLQKNTRILDIGSKWGQVVLELRHISNAMGLEINSEITDSFTQAGLDFIKKGGFETFESTEPFDILLFDFSIMHMPDIATVFSKVKSLLKPGGICIVNDRNPAASTDSKGNTNPGAIHRLSIPFSERIKKDFQFSRVYSLLADSKKGPFQPSEGKNLKDFPYLRIVFINS